MKILNKDKLRIIKNILKGKPTIYGVKFPAYLKLKMALQDIDLIECEFEGNPTSDGIIMNCIFYNCKIEDSTIHSSTVWYDNEFKNKLDAIKSILQGKSVVYNVTFPPHLRLKLAYEDIFIVGCTFEGGYLEVEQIKKEEK